MSRCLGGGTYSQSTQQQDCQWKSGDVMFSNISLGLPECFELDVMKQDYMPIISLWDFIHIPALSTWYDVSSEITWSSVCNNCSSSTKTPAPTITYYSDNPGTYFSVSNWNILFVNNLTIEDLPNSTIKGTITLKLDNVYNQVDGQYYSLLWERDYKSQNQFQGLNLVCTAKTINTYNSRRIYIHDHYEDF